MITIQKILVATDFSEHSATAIVYAAELARVFDAEVVLCHVVEKPDFLSQLPPGGEGYFPPNFAEMNRQRAQEECDRLLANSKVARGRVLIIEGTPFVELIRVARDEKVDLVIVGTHGRGAIAHMLLGSVAEKIVRKAPCAVLTVRQGEHEFVMP